jgi:hypothetical protein
MNLIEIQSPHEQKKIKSLLGQTYDLLKEAKAVLAGGAITSLFCNREINDFDVYLPSKKVLFDILYDIYVTKDSGLWVNHITKKSIMTKNNFEASEANVQLILCQYFEKIQDIFSAFDFTVCMGAYDFGREVFVLHEDFLRHNAQRVLRFNPGTLYPLISLLRVSKYQEKGYNISKRDYTAIAVTCSKIKFDNWDKVEDQLAGMYGLAIDEVFDTEKECSADEVLEQLSKLELDFGMYPDNSQNKREEREIVERFFSEEIKTMYDLNSLNKEWSPQFDPMKYYKCVNRYYMSAGTSGSQVIRYNLDSIVNGGDNGIYVHRNPTHPSHPCGYLIHWVELEPINIRGIHDESREQLRIVGDLKVTKQFVYDPRNNGSRSPDSDMELLKPYFDDKGKLGGQNDSTNNQG